MRPLHANTRSLTFIAVLFHLIGLMGMLIGGAGFARATPFHLALMFLLLLFSYRSDIKMFGIAAFLIWTGGFAAEWTGVHTGALFGSYSYGKTLGPKWMDIPLLIGCNWAIVICGAASIGQKLVSRWRPTNKKNIFPVTAVCAWAAISAMLATAADWLLEPVAIRLGYWQWSGGIIPAYNYLCWAGISFLLSFLWGFFRIAPNQFGINLFIIQCIFFTLLRFLL